MRRPAGLPGLFGRQAVNRAVVEADPGAVGEALPANAANKGPLARVDAGVNLQGSRLGETLPALQATVRFLPGVDTLVRPHARQVWEAPAAEPAGVRPLARVDAPVNLKRPRLAETLAAVGAGVRPGARVHVEVDAQVAVRVEGAAALGAQEARGLLGVLGALVLQQLGRPGEGSRAVHAGVRQRVSAPVVELLRLLVLLVEVAGAHGEGALVAAQARREGAGDLRATRAHELRAGQAGRQGTVVVVEVMVGVGQGGVRRPLLAADLGAGLEAPVATQAGKDGQVRQGSRGDPGGGQVSDLVWTVSIIVCLVSLRSAGHHSTAAARLIIRLTLAFCVQVRQRG